MHVFDKTYLIHELLVVRPSAGQRAPEKKFDAITNVKWPEIFQCLCQQLKSVNKINVHRKILNRILKLVFTSMSSPKTRGSMLTASKWRSRQSPMQSLPDTLRIEKCQLSDEWWAHWLIIWNNKTQRQLCKRLAGPFIPFSWSCLVWKRVLLWIWSLGGSQQPFFCVLGHFRHGDKQTNNQPTGWS